MGEKRNELGVSGEEWEWSAGGMRTRGRRDNGFAEEDERRRRYLVSSERTGARNGWEMNYCLWWGPLSATTTKKRRKKKVGAQPSR